MSRSRTVLWLLLAGALLLVAAAAVYHGMDFDGSRHFSGVLAGVGAGLWIGAGLRRLMPEDCDGDRPALRRRYNRELLLAMAAYALLLVLSITLLRHVQGTGLRALVALLPLPPIVFVLRAMIRYIRDADELQQRIELEAVSSATAIVSLLYLTGGFLQTAKVIDVPSAAAMIWVFPLVSLSYGLAKAVVVRRYR